MDFWSVIILFFLVVLVVNFTYSLYALVIQIQTKDTVKDSWGWITLRVLAVIGSLRGIYVIVKNGLK
jgi:hypothetical protein